MLSAQTTASPLTLSEFAAALAALARFEARPLVAVAVSGGPDSLALAILADRWARERDGEICALTVDHGLRPESGAEIRQLAGWLAARAIRHEVLVWCGEKPRSGVQEAARDARYRLLAGWCRAHGCLHLLTGHHREDQIETHLIRRRAHSGADGLAGMSAVRELDCCRLLRPLLNLPKDRLRAFLSAERQPFITDPSNLDPAFERARLRRGDDQSSRTDADRMVDDIRKLGAARTRREGDVNRLLARHVSVHPAGFAVLDPCIVRSAPPDIAERLLSATVAAIGGAGHPLRRKRIAGLRQALAEPRRGHTLGGCRLVRWRGRVLVLREPARAAAPMRLAPGDELVWDRRFRVGLSAAAGKPFTIGHLGRAGVAELDRRGPRAAPDALPRLILPIFPAVWDEHGIAAVPHLGYRRDGAGALPRIVFQPVNPLTGAGFAVV